MTLKNHNNTFLVINGGIPLNGYVDVSGSKNASLPILVSSILFDKPVTISNIPDITDVGVILDLISQIGASVSRSNGSVTIDVKKVNNHKINHTASSLRSSILLVGPMLQRCGKVNIPMPGGCKIGSRLIDIHLKAFKMMGAKIKTFNSSLEIITEQPLRSIEITLPIKSVGATQHIILSSVLNKGTTIIRNAAREPEIVELCDFLNNCGARIIGAGSNKILVDGVKTLQPKNYRIQGDRMEAGTYAIAIAATKGKGELRNIKSYQVPELWNLFEAIGIGIRETKNGIAISADNSVQSIDLTTSPYPGFPTDLQAPITALFTCAGNGKVFRVTEMVHNDRFGHVSELLKMGADIQIKKDMVTIKSKNKLCPAVVMGTDLRATKALIIAGLTASGKTSVFGLEHLYRGYENIVQKLQNMGAKITEETEQTE
ncbi:MAG: UDP-N-acetylglucosamine 1-carboxyvinyltransferase [Alphaproteobacteria bacterium]|nr:UDP-N-acetylglucosamine 1-carboxyvinyltransferase [Rickettsiales bacterium]